MYSDSIQSTAATEMVAQNTSGSTSPVGIGYLSACEVETAGTNGNRWRFFRSTGGTGAASSTPEKLSSRSVAPGSTFVTSFSADPTKSGNDLLTLSPAPSGTQKILWQWWVPNPRYPIYQQTSEQITLQYDFGGATNVIAVRTIVFNEPENDTSQPQRVIRDRARVRGYEHMHSYNGKVGATGASWALNPICVNYVRTDDWPDGWYWNTRWNINLFGSAGTLFTQDLAASMSTFDATLIRLPGKAFSASMSTFDGTLTKQALKSLTASMSTFAATVTKRTSKFLDASMSTFGGVLTTVRVFLQTLTASMATFDASLVKQTGKALSASMSTFAGALVKQTNHLLSASMSTFSGVLTEVIIFTKDLPASMSTFSATLSEVFQAGPGGAVQTIRNFFRRSM